MAFMQRARFEKDIVYNCYNFFSRNEFVPIYTIYIYSNAIRKYIKINS